MDQFVAPVVGNTTPSVTAPKVRKDIANIFFVLDKSGSMCWMQQQAIDGFNQYVSKQKELDGITKMTLVQFSTTRSISYQGLDIHQVPMLTPQTYRPDGGTALNDAVGYVLSENLATCSPDETNIIAILTDGEENSSKEYRLEHVKALLAQAEAKGWEILFLGANMTKDAVVGTYGINASNVSAFEASAKGMSDAFTTLSATTTSYRGMKSAGMLNEKVDVEAVYAATSASVVDSSPGASVMGGSSVAGQSFQLNPKAMEAALGFKNAFDAAIAKSAAKKAVDGSVK